MFCVHLNLAYKVIFLPQFSLDGISLPQSLLVITQILGTAEEENYPLLIFVLIL